jgi:hypothetical protein
MELVYHCVRSIASESEREYLDDCIHFELLQVPCRAVLTTVVMMVIYENIMIRLVFRWVAPRHSASSGCGWRRRPADGEGSCVLNKWFADSGWSFSWVDWAWNKISLIPQHVAGIHRASDGFAVLENESYKSV